MVRDPLKERRVGAVQDRRSAPGRQPDRCDRHLAKPVTCAARRSPRSVPTIFPMGGRPSDMEEHRGRAVGGGRVVDLIVGWRRGNGPAFGMGATSGSCDPQLHRVQMWCRRSRKPLSVEMMAPACWPRSRERALLRETALLEPDSREGTLRAEHIEVVDQSFSRNVDARIRVRATQRCKDLLGTRRGASSCRPAFLSDPFVSIAACRPPSGSLPGSLSIRSCAEDEDSPSTASSARRTASCRPG